MNERYNVMNRIHLDWHPFVHVLDLVKSVLPSRPMSFHGVQMRFRQVLTILN